jgi:hypothetical protein
MILCNYLGSLQSTEYDIELTFPIGIREWLGLDKEHPSLYGYGDVSEINQIYLSAIPLSKMVFSLTIFLKDEKGSCHDVLEYLRKNDISILRTDIRSLIHMACWELIIEFKYNISEDKIDIIRNEIKKTCSSVLNLWILPINHKLPSDEQKNCIIDMNSSEYFTFRSEPGGSPILIMKKNCIEKLRKNHPVGEKKAVLGIYSQIPLMVVNFFDKNAKLIELSYEIHDKIGAFHDAIRPVIDVCSIIGCNATIARKNSDHQSYGGICSGIFYLRDGKGVYDLKDVLKNNPQIGVRRGPIRLDWSPSDDDTFLTGLTRFLKATWVGQDIGKPIHESYKHRYHKAIKLDEFKISNVKPINVIFTIQRVSGEIKITIHLIGTSQGINEEEANKSLATLNIEFERYRKQILERLKYDVDWEN